jgi:Ca2+-binding EF-hand superfamily protein
VTAQDLREALTELGDYMDPAEIEELIYEADFQGNGQIAYMDFCNMLFMWEK